MQLFRAQLSKYIPHPHRDSWMRNHLDKWLHLLRLSSALTLLAAAWSIARTSSPLGIYGQFQTILEQTTAQLLNENTQNQLSIGELQSYIKYAFAAFFIIAALASMRCGERKKKKYIIPVFIAGLLMVIAALKHFIESHFEIISIIPFILPVAIPFLLLGYRRLANKIDHWNYYANFLCTATAFGNALTFLFYPDKLIRFKESIFTSLGLLISSEQLALTTFSYITISSAFLTAFPITRRLGLFALIAIGAVSCIYRILALSFNSEITISFDLIIADFFFYNSYWLIPLLILLSLASRRKTQTLKL